jgi:molybdopterin synthase sulfur carrier subunit
MDVCFYATLRQIVGTKRVPFEFPDGITVRDVLHAAEKRFPDLTPLLWEADGSLSDYIKVFVDGREMRHLRGLDTPVPAGAQLDVFPPAAGG